MVPDLKTQLVFYIAFFEKQHYLYLGYYFMLTKYYTNVTKHYTAFHLYTLGHLPGANPNLHFTKQLELKLRILIKLYTIFPLYAFKIEKPIFTQHLLLFVV